MLRRLMCLRESHRYHYNRNIRDDVRILFAFDGSTEVTCSRCHKTIYIKDYLVPSHMIKEHEDID